MSSVLAVIVNYRTPDLAIDCLASLAGQLDPAAGGRAVVVDNASGDDSIERIRAAIDERGWRDLAELLPHEENGGFAAGNNAAIAPALKTNRPPDYVLLLNSDTVARPGAVKALSDFLDAHPRVGIVGSRLEDPDGTPQHSRYRFPGIRSELEVAIHFGPITRLLKNYMVTVPISDEPHQIDWVCGGSMMIRREVFEQVGLLDERYFMYYEETDFALAARKAGWQCWYVPDSHVIHLVGRSSGVTVRESRPPRVPPYWFESRRRYFIKNHGRVYAAMVDGVSIVGCVLWRMRRAIQRKPDRDPPYFLLDRIRHSVFLKGFQT
jgi:hypothetical protein